jgi:uncharacterized protein (TIGR03435 family)
MARGIARLLSFGLLLAAVSRAQTGAAPSALPKFEVASVRASVSTGGQLASERERGWGNVTGRVNLLHIPLRFVLLRVYNLRSYQLSGPAWLETEPFDILANVPAGTPKEQIPLMFQDLPAERFKLKFHRETQTSPVYALVVAEGGPKVTEGLSDDPGEADAVSTKISGTAENRSKSGTLTGKFGSFKLTAANGSLRWEFAGIGMNGLAEFLSQGLVDLPVVDMTNLGGSYQVPLEVSMSDMPKGANQPPADQGGAGQPATGASDPPGGISVRGSLQKLGLRLVRQRAPIEKFVIDHVERVPTGN